VGAEDEVFAGELVPPEWAAALLGGPLSAVLAVTLFEPTGAALTIERGTSWATDRDDDVRSAARRSPPGPCWLGMNWARTKAENVMASAHDPVVNRHETVPRHLRARRPR
jgi:hypothetical protein